MSCLFFHLDAFFFFFFFFVTAVIYCSSLLPLFPDCTHCHDQTVLTLAWPRGLYRQTCDQTALTCLRDQRDWCRMQQVSVSGWMTWPDWVHCPGCQHTERINHDTCSWLGFLVALFVCLFVCLFAESITGYLKAIQPRRLTGLPPRKSVGGG